MRDCKKSQDLYFFKNFNCVIKHSVFHVYVLYTLNNSTILSFDQLRIRFAPPHLQPADLYKRNNKLNRNEWQISWVRLFKLVMRSERTEWAEGLAWGRCRESVLRGRSRAGPSLVDRTGFSLARLSTSPNTKWQLGQLQSGKIL